MKQSKSFFSVRVVAFITMLCLAAALLPVAKPAKSDAAIVKYGDVDCNGSINIIDVMSVLSYISDSKTLIGSGFVAADANGDNSIDVSDAVAIYKGLKGSQVLPSENTADIDNIDNWLTDAGNTTVLTLAQIQAYNEKVVDAVDRVVDIYDTTVPGTLSASTITGYINASCTSAPSGFSAAYTNRNISNVTAGGKFGIVTQRDNVRNLPTANRNGEQDSIQETEVEVGMPVWVLHTSSDGAYYYIQSYYYRGWVLASSIATTTDMTLWNSFASPSDYVVITDTLYKTADGTKLDMSVRLPRVSTNTDSFTVTIPSRTSNGTLTTKTADIPKTSANHGYLTYTYNNVLIQAFKYLNQDYGWGGLDDGVDCSGFVANVFRSFGFMLPRNSGEQSPNGYAALMKGDSTNPSAEQCLSLRGNTPMIFGSAGHVRIYIGTMDGTHYIIHAPKVGQQVCVIPFSSWSSLTYVAKMA